MNAKKISKPQAAEAVKPEKAKEALVLIECKGKTAIIGVLDIMPKTAEVSFVNRINIGSGLVTVIYTGEVAASNSAAEAARNLAGKIGELNAVTVIPRPHKRIHTLVTQKSGESIVQGKGQALGIIEAAGFIGMIEAADKGIKAANVVIPGWVTVGSGLTTVFFRGEVAAVYAAVEAGCAACEKVSKTVAAHVIPQPHLGTEEAAPIGLFSGPSVFSKVDPDSALGILETRGITGLIEGIDAGLKAANTVIQGWEKIGKGMTSTIFRGTVADVKSSLDAAVSSANTAGEVVGSYVIARPHLELEKGR